MAISVAMETGGGVAVGEEGGVVEDEAAEVVATSWN